MKKICWHLAILLLVTATIYSNTLDVPFNFDDSDYILKNPLIQAPLLKMLQWDYVSGYLGQLNFDIINNMMIRPVAYITFNLNFKMGGLDLAGWHLVNVAIHLAAALSVYLMVYYLLKTPWVAESNCPEKVRNYLPLWVALLFACHPVQTQAVTYVIQRFTSLAACFYFASVALYLKARICSYGVKTVLLIGASVLSGLLGMGTKEIVFTLPVTILIIESCFFYGTIRSRIVYLVPYSLLLLVIPLNLMLLHGRHDIEDGFFDTTMYMASSGETVFTSYLVTQFRVMMTYLRLLVLPVNQNLDYDYPLYHSLFEAPVFISFVALLIIITLAAIAFRISCKPGPWRVPLRLAAFGVVWFFVTISVSSSVVVLDDLIFEHRLYLPSFGLILSFCSLVAGFWCINQEKLPVIRYLIPASMIAVVAIFAVAAFRRNNVWRDYVGFWSDVVAKSPNKARPHKFLGRSYSRINRHDLALLEYGRALQLEPGNWKRYVNVGVAEQALNNLPAAAVAFQRALLLNSNSSDAAANLGKIYMGWGQYAAAASMFEIWARSSKPPPTESLEYLAEARKKLVAQ